MATHDETNITDYGFTAEEAGDIAIGLELYRRWAEEYPVNADTRYADLFRNYCGGSDAGTLILAGFFGGLGKGLELAEIMEKERADA